MMTNSRRHNTSLLEPEKMPRCSGKESALSISLIAPPPKVVRGILKNNAKIVMYSMNLCLNVMTDKKKSAERMYSAPAE